MTAKPPSIRIADPDTKEKPGVETGTSGTRVKYIQKLDTKLTNLRRAPLKWSPNEYDNP